MTMIISLWPIYLGYIYFLMVLVSGRMPILEEDVSPMKIQQQDIDSQRQLNPKMMMMLLTEASSNNKTKSNYGYRRLYSELINNLLLNRESTLEQQQKQMVHRPHRPRPFEELFSKFLRKSGLYLPDSPDQRMIRMLRSQGFIRFGRDQTKRPHDAEDDTAFLRFGRQPAVTESSSQVTDQGE